MATLSPTSAKLATRAAQAATVRLPHSATIALSDSSCRTEQCASRTAQQAISAMCLIVSARRAIRVAKLAREPATTVNRAQATTSCLTPSA